MPANDDKNLEHHSDFNTFHEEYSGLIDKLTELFCDRERLLNHTRYNIEIEYYLLLGKDQLEVIKLDVECRRLKFKCELIQNSLGTSSAVDLDVIRTKTDYKMEEWKKKIEDMKKKIVYAEFAKEHFLSIEETKEINIVYRNLAKKLHPEINKYLSQELIDMWRSVQKAYKNSELNTLINIESIISKVISTSAASREIIDYEYTNEKLKDKIAILENEIMEIKKQYPFTMLEKIADNEWIEKEKSFLSEKNETLNAQVNYYKNRLQYLEMLCHDGKHCNN